MNKKKTNCPSFFNCSHLITTTILKFLYPKELFYLVTISKRFKAECERIIKELLVETLDMSPPNNIIDCWKAVFLLNSRDPKRLLKLLYWIIS